MSRRIAIVVAVMIGTMLAVPCEPPSVRAERPRAGTLGACAITLTSGQYWRSQILGGPRGSSPDGYGPMTISIGAHIECTADTQISIARAWAIVGRRRTALRRPALYVERSMTDWDGRLVAGVPMDVLFTWQGGPFAPGSRAGGIAHGIVRFRAGAATLELEAPPNDVGFPG